jgi:hypothetical protein
MATTLPLNKFRLLTKTLDSGSNLIYRENIDVSTIILSSQITNITGSNQTVSVNPQPSTLARGHIDMSGIIAIGASPIVDPPLSSAFLTNVPVTSVSSAVYFTSTDATGANVVVCDSGQFLTGAVNNGLLMSQKRHTFQL